MAELEDLEFYEEEHEVSGTWMEREMHGETEREMGSEMHQEMEWQMMMMQYEMEKIYN